jgi:hypothetical protein
MRRLLIVSPNFPPVNAPDMHRVRMSLPYFPDFGWESIVLAVDPECTERVTDPALLQTIPADVPIHRTGAFSVRWTRKLGIGDLGLRALPSLHREGVRLIKEHKPDLIYFSTTIFPVFVLGRLWKQRFGVPFVVDMQDPWFDDCHDRRPRHERPPKYWLANRMHGMLEPFTMKAVDGVIAVSASYHETLRQRYPWIRANLCRTIPFSASEKDFELVTELNFKQTLFDPKDDKRHWVYVGRGGMDMQLAAGAFFIALARFLEGRPEKRARLRLHFAGTDYAPKELARKTIEPLATSYGVGDLVSEQTDRIPYLEVLRCLSDADALIIPGSDDPTYTASKIYPYILAKRPIVAVFHEESSVVDVLKKTKAGTVVTFTQRDNRESLASKILQSGWLESNLDQGKPAFPTTDWSAFAPYSAREMTRRQCELFDQVLAQSSVQTRSVAVL